MILIVINQTNQTQLHMEVSTPERINKEKILSLKCLSSEVLQCPDDFMKRRLMLQRATQLSHTFYTKTKITFETTEGIKEVFTTIWAVTERNIILKGGVALPVCCIREVIIS